MKITENIDWRINIADIETLAEYILLSFYNVDTKEWNEFEIGEYSNDILPFAKFYDKNEIDYNVFYNGIKFDGPILEYIYRNYNDWLNLSGIEIARKIYQYSQDVINDTNYGAFLEYREDMFSVKVLDPFTILGLDNEARRSSLKKCQFQLDLPSVEEMPIHHTKKNLTKEEIIQIKSYCRNDIMSLYELFKLVLGNTAHIVYKNNNQLELRLSIQEEFDINCLNYSDIKLGEELMKKSYSDEKGITLKELPRKGTFRKQVALSKCIPKYVTFKTDKLKTLLKEIKAVKLGRNGKWERVIKIATTEYVQSLGGLHSVNKNEIWIAGEDYYIEDDDASSYYPKIICDNGYYPTHLGKELLKVYKTIYNRRLELKPLAKTDKKIKGIVEAFKLLLNSIFGKLGSMESWLYDLQALYSVTLTGQYSLLMLIEEFELNGIKVISANSDGITTYFKKELLEKKQEIVKKWQEITNFEIETVRFNKFIYSSVNDYIAVPTEGKTKKKGSFITEYELWKNKSWRVVSLALEAYFIDGKNPIDFIENHDNIFDFCLMTRATGDLYLEMQRKSEEGVFDSTNTVRLKKLVRYYLSSEKEWQLYKRGIGSTGKNANISLHADNELGRIYVQYFNQWQQKEMKDYNIDYSQYIYKCLKMIDSVEKGNKLKTYINKLNNDTQLSLF